MAWYTAVTRMLRAISSSMYSLGKLTTLVALSARENECPRVNAVITIRSRRQSLKGKASVSKATKRI